MDRLSVSAATSQSDDNRTARDILEGFGKEIQQKASKEAQRRSKGLLKGKLSEAKFKVDSNKAKEPCQLDHTKHTNVKKGHEKENPCYGREEERFSDAGSGQCTYNRIKDNENNDNSIGACAPYRRLHICDYNLENIDPEKITSTHNLLADVLLVAKHEGQTLVEKHKEYKGKNKDFDSNICIALARSFADIGDIIRGKDLFLGHKKEKLDLEKKLKNIFKNIYDDLKDSKAKEDYKDDNGGNFYKLREDWWNENRDQVWRAITCHAEKNDIYSKTIEYNKTGVSNGKCGHEDANVQTYLDYVPQFLRWFDEWGEEFCRIRNHKLQNVKKECRDDKKELYCSRNGYDCTNIIGNEEFFSRDSKCTGCSVKCISYEIWLENQRKEFEKQNKKYKKEINGNNSPPDNTNNSFNNKYHKEFYEELKKNYNDVENFLNLLNKGKYCQKTIAEEENIDFSNNVDKTFSYSKHCKVCPDCGVTCKDGNCVEIKNGSNCRKFKVYVPPDGVKPTTIDIIDSGNKPGNITQKLKDFCKEENIENEKNYKKWECYYKNKNENKCKISKNTGNNTEEDKVISFDEFFHSWVKNLLIDSIKWENDLKVCLNNTGVTDCNDGCNIHCVCLDKWLKKKEKEWKSVKKVFENKNGTSHNYYNKLNGLFDSFFFEVMNEFNQDETKWKELTKKLEEIIGSSNIINGKENSQDAIKVLFDHLKETATTCKDNNTNEACLSTVDPTKNPCIKNTITTGGNNKRATVKQIAQYYKREAHAQLEEGGGSRSALKGDASKGEYKNGGNPSKLKNVCKISKVHSNRNHKRSKGPCYRKGTGEGLNTRFEIGTMWQADPTQIREGHEDVLIPPRRRHMCISNLENLNTMNVGLTGANASHSLLGDVILSAKYEAQKIILMYKQKNNVRNENVLNDPKHHATICRSIRYSFADIGDIIRGKEMWDRDGDSQRMESRLVKIFKKIKEQLNGKLNGKYTGDDSKYLELRSDWWEANRDQVWKAMQCPITSSSSSSYRGNNITCDSDHTPLDDYIPQRLRWMTEWAEWYCKAQNKYYGELMKGCQKCKGDSNGKNCYKDTSDCSTCTQACTTYANKIKAWAEQWTKIKDKYLILYGEAKTSAFNGSPDYYKYSVQKEDKRVVEFLQKLHEANGGTRGPPIDAFRKGSSSVITRVEHAATSNNTPYDNIGAYLHDTANFKDCQKQDHFCEYKGGLTSGINNDHYAFRHQPHDNDTPCSCEEREKRDQICQMVKVLLNGKENINTIEGCNKKTDRPWDCENNIDPKYTGACMPPRRQSLCIYNLRFSNKMQDKEQMRKEFINCAAIETHYLWKYYTEKNNSAKIELKNGTIPKNFRRWMEYTFADYRDLFFGTDISNHKNIITVKNNVNNVLNKTSLEKRSNLNDIKNEWWKKHGPDIWIGMLCALNNGIDNKKEKNKIMEEPQYKVPPEEFAKKPQFLRWMIEWGEEFCAERKKLEEAVGRSCSGGNSGDYCNNRKDLCNIACEKYKNYVEKKQKEFTGQTNKFVQKANERSKNSEYIGYESKQGNDYLLAKCDNNKCSCMTGVVSSDNPKDKPFGKYFNNTLEMCNCTSGVHKPTALPVLPQQTDACNNLKKYIDENEIEKNKTQRCNKKIYNGWDCKSDIHTNHKGACMPPRRKSLCIYKLTRDNDTKTIDQLKMSFIKSAALETYLAWEIYKGNNIDAVRQLQNGDIPEDFKRQMFYTFGDFRDMCLGTDISKKGNPIMGVGKVESSINKLFRNGENSNKQNRKTWWNSIEKEVWEGMLCGLSHHIKNGKKGLLTPKTEYDYKNVTFDGITKLEDFATRPQFLRWMTEWGDEFCKKQSQEYNDLKEKCTGCDFSNDGNCTQKGNCKNCSSECTKYQKFITQWKGQWTTQSKKYEQLYTKAITKGFNGTVDETEKKLLEYLKELNEPNGNNNEYSTAGKYVNHKGYISDCQEQKNFDENNNDGNDEKYSFKEYPHDHENKCNCKEAVTSPLPKTPEVLEKEKNDEVCNLVKKHFQLRNAESGKIDGCTEKGHKTWSCNSSDIESGNDGACMPPRRQALCISNLKFKGETVDENKLREAFIKCVAKEIHFLWEKYKKNKNEADTQLKTGIIPDDFKRMMYYTFADYKDIFFGTDISKNTGNISKVNENINKLFNHNNGLEKEKHNSERVAWWKNHGHEIWEAMLCALSYDTKDKQFKEELKKELINKNKYTNLTTSLEEFAKRPTFLRWYIEWSDEFCTERQEKEKKVSDACSTDYEGCEKDKNNSDCANACEGYTKYITAKKTEYNTQKDKFYADKNHKKQGYEGYSNTQASDYLKEKCLDDSCSCMENVKSITDYWTNSHTTYEHKSLQTKCICPPSPCDIVDGILGTKDGTGYSDGCKWKYDTTRKGLVGWDCNNSVEKGNQGACIPPRRRRLYLKNIEDLTDTSPSGLRTAFIEDAAIETFFSWHEFKMDKKPPQKEQEQNVLNPTILADLGFGKEEKNPSADEKAQKDLENGKIPDEFLHEMFYTFGDYRDILFSGSKDKGSAMDDIFSRIDKDTKDKIKKAIEGVFTTSDGKKPSENPRENWWQNYGPDIWEGMICALSYDTEKRTKDEKVHTNLISNIQNKNKYDYDKVTISSIPINPNESTKTSTTTTLSDFAKRPTFIRWLEEWGEEFCRKRKDKLKKVKDKCRGLNFNGDEIYCSGDGHDCKRRDINRDQVFADIDCPDCEKVCTNYKKWIKNKKHEFDNQKLKYDNEIEKSNTSSKNDHGEKYYQELKGKGCLSVDKFLESLNHCKHYEGKEDEKNKIDFKNPDKTFSPSTYCKACPLYGVNCPMYGPCTPKIINDENDKGESTTFDILLDDGATKVIDQDLEKDCTKYGLYKNLRKQEWKCHKKKNGVYKCKINKVVDSLYYDDKMEFNVLFQRWINDFLENYYKSNEQIDVCTKKGENTCECVGKWVEKKKKEWSQIKTHFSKENDDPGYNIEYKVKGFFEKDPFFSYFLKSMKGVDDIQSLQQLKDCTNNDCRLQEIQKVNHDFITKLLENLEKKVKSCKTHPGETQSHCVPLPQPDNPDLDDTPDEQTKEQPAFCMEDHIGKEPEMPKSEQVPEQPEAQPDPTEESNGAAHPGELQEEEEEKDKGDEEEEEEDEEDEEEEEEEEDYDELDSDFYDDDSDSETEEEDEDEAVPNSLSPSESRPKRLTREFPSPELKNSMFSSTIMWSVGISIAAISYFLLKKKLKSPVDLLRVLDIHKGDYDIPTFKSKNRYIPYKSAQYKGKTYLYVEGDTDEDKYIGDITSSDITSSESEYEELDINDIYPYQSPKYKTMIEVVLEPSTRDTFNTPSADTPSNKFTEEEWNQLKDEFISQYLPNTEPNNNYTSGNFTLNTQRNTLYFDKPQEKSFIMSIHDRNLLSGEEISYNVNMSTNTNNDIPISSKNDVYSGIDLINDSLNSGNQPIDIYDEILKRKENELFGTNHPKNTSNNSVAKLTNSDDPLLNQLNLFHKWLDRHRDMCEKWEKGNKEELLDKLKEEWNKDNDGGDIYTSNGNKTLNTNVSIEIDMDNTKPINIVDINPDNSFMDTMEDDIYYDVNDYNNNNNQLSVDDIPMDYNKVDVDVPKKVHVEMKILINTSNGSLEQQFPISDVWNI
ncbi:erythrocyte membrane protein 1, PfEMP1, putative [Plasmodium reichenowi]|uniref:Erythrocyte membrane protein 1, PfEMP1, putative n=1 Tax=Plasmodium reichenowi TaxID=5854 RepID=A0A2P9DBI8_PLARE|nr:erythrocyte membrane protein 1, PfEMP1, putative [Plasmodium reichenowi]